MSRSTAAALWHAFSDSVLSVGGYVLSYRIGVAFYRHLVMRESVRPQ